MGVQLMRIERRKGTSPSPIPNEPRPALPTPRGCGGQWLLFRGDPSSLDAPDALPGLTQGLLHARTHACASPSHALWHPVPESHRPRGTCQLPAVPVVVPPLPASLSEISFICPKHLLSTFNLPIGLGPLGPPPSSVLIGLDIYWRIFSVERQGATKPKGRRAVAASIYSQSPRSQPGLSLGNQYSVVIWS